MKAMSVFGPSRQAAFFGPTVANGALRTWLDLQLAPPSRECRVGPGNFTPSLSQIPDVNLSIHPARATARRLPPSIVHRAPPAAGHPTAVDPIQCR